MAERLPPAEGSSDRRRPRVLAIGHNLTASGQGVNLAGLPPSHSRSCYLTTILVDKLVGISLREDRPPSKSNNPVTLLNF